MNYHGGRIPVMVLAAAGVVLQPGPGWAVQVDQGQEIFQRLCVMCHTVGGGRLVGPDLQNLHERRSEQWIIPFVQHSQQLVGEGDPDAVAVFEEYGGIIMPDQPVSDAEVRSIVEYIKGGQPTGAAQTVMEPVTDEQVVLGQELFQGTRRFTNGGPTCNACHDVTNDAVIGGGVLATELTTVFSRLGGAGVRAILGSPHSP